MEAFSNTDGRDPSKKHAVKAKPVTIAMLLKGGGLHGDAPLDDISDDGSVEVTEEDHQSYCQPEPHKKTKERVKRGRNRIFPLSSEDSVCTTWEDDFSVVSGITVHSTTDYTVGSMDTVKISNTTNAKAIEARRVDKRRWGRLMGLKKQDRVKLARQYSVSEQRYRDNDSLSIFSSENSLSRRVRSNPVFLSVGTNSNQSVSATEKNVLDESMYGSFDGITSLHICGVPYSWSSRATASSVLSRNKGLSHSFSGQSLEPSASQIVSRMLWSSARRSKPEIVLEGHNPGTIGRWSVRVEVIPKHVKQNGKHGASSVSPTETDLSSERLQSTIWGSDPIPADILARQGHTIRCSVPIDKDEETFIISSARHVSAVHEIVGQKLASGNFEFALKLLEALLQGLKGSKNPRLGFLSASTLHNMGVVCIWLAQYEIAARLLENAIKGRKALLPAGHPDLAVSLSQYAVALFALGRFDKSVQNFEKASRLLDQNHSMKAKVLNNEGVARFFLCDYKNALQNLTTSLDMQKSLLRGQLRRECIVYEAAVVSSNLGRVKFLRSDLKSASRNFQESLALQRSILRRNHDILCDTLMTLALVNARQGDLVRALEIVDGCLRTANSSLGVVPAATVDMIGLQGVLYAKAGNIKKAKNCLTLVRKWQKTEAMTSNHPSVVYTKACLQAINSVEPPNPKVKTDSGKVWI